MKKSIALFTMLIVAIATIIFSCTRLSVPVPAASCIQVALSSATGTTSQTVTVNTAITPITYAVTGSITGDTTAIDTLSVNVLGSLPPGVTETFSGGVFTISGTPTTSVGSPFNYTVTTTGSSCNNVAIAGSITVTNCSTITLTSAAVTASQTVVINNAITPITYALGGGATGESVIGMPAGVTGTFAAGVLTISGAPTSSAGSPYTYTVTTTGGACTATATGTIIVGSSGIVTVTVPGSIAVCNGSTVAATTFNSAPAGATYTWTNTNTAIGLAAAGTGNIASFTATNTTGSPITATITVTPTSATLGTGTSNGYTITVNPLSTITLTSGVTPQTVSSGTAITSIVYAIGGGATGATLTGAPAGVFGTLVGSVFTISGTPTTTAGPFNYTVATTGSTCTSTATGTITVTP